VVVDSFNRVEAQDKELSEALAELLSAANDSGDPEAVELAEGLIEFAGSGKRSLFQSAWERLKEMAPIAGAAASVAATVARFLAEN
jgi:hypothetical protein